MAFEQLPHKTQAEALTLPELPTVPTLQGYHVTDDPQRVLTALQNGLPLDRGIDVSPTDDLQASGLYFSEHPQLWTARAANKWKFAGRLALEQRGAIAQAILQDRRFTEAGYLTDGEKARAATWLQRFTDGGQGVYLEFLAEQPYNVASWKPSFLAPFGITNDEQPHLVPIRVAGRFADVSSARLSPDLIIALKRSGHDGAYIHASIALLPQAVVWNNRAVVQFGDYAPADLDS